MKNYLKDIGGIPVTQLAGDFGTPLFIYKRDVIEQRLNQVKVFDVVRFAQKACSNLAILAVMRKGGAVVDAVSAGEIHRALKAGFSAREGASDIVYTADIFDDDAVDLLKKYPIPINVGSPDMITQAGAFAPGRDIILRINPGFGHGHSQKVNTGGPLSKHGIWHGDLSECTRLGRQAGVNICGIHMHIGSGSDFEHLSQVCDAMVKVASNLGPQLKVISTGGGLPIPYHHGEPGVDVSAFYKLWDDARKKIEESVGHKVSLETEPGRFLVAESCSLLTQIRSIKNTGGNGFYLVNAGFDTLIRPAMYGAYHEISICPADDRKISETCEVVVGGPLCESCDVFTQGEGGDVVKRELPQAKVGDFLIIHDAGAYGSVMSSNYNSRRLAAEVLISNGNPELIRERQPFEALWQYERVPESLK